MQAVAYARITSFEMAEDATRQAEGCQLTRDALRVNANTISALAGMLSYPDAPPGRAKNLREAVETVIGSLLQLAGGLDETANRLGAHAAAWKREGEVWSQVMDQGGLE
jgi:hypothetical protein